MTPKVSTNISSFDPYILTFFGCLLVFVFNPLYVLLLFLFLERLIRIPITLNYFFAFSISLFFINRDFGKSWSGSDGMTFANDDVLVYLDYYRNLWTDDFYKNADLHIYGGGEPVWFLLACIVKFLSFSSVFCIICFSVFLPVFFLHFVFSKISVDFCFNVAFFYIFFPEINHIFYHLWRYSLSLAFTLCLCVYSLNNNRFNIKLSLLSILSHITSFLTAFVLFCVSIHKYSYLKNIFFARIFFLLSFLCFGFILFFFFWSIFDYIQLDKVNFYLRSDEVVVPFFYSSRHFLYMFISIYLLFLSKNIKILSIALLNLLSLLIPSVFTVTVVYERLLLLLVPLLIVSFLFHIKQKIYIKNLLFLPMVIVFYNFVQNCDGQLFYAYMSRGHLFDLFNGIIINLYDICCY